MHFPLSTIWIPLPPLLRNTSKTALGSAVRGALGETLFSGQLKLPTRVNEPVDRFHFPQMAGRWRNTRTSRTVAERWRSVRTTQSPDVSAVRDYPFSKSPSKNGTGEFGTSRRNVNMSDMWCLSHFPLGSNQEFWESIGMCAGLFWYCSLHYSHFEKYDYIF